MLVFPHTLTIYIEVDQVKRNIKDRPIREENLQKGNLLFEQVWGWVTQTYLLCPSDSGEIINYRHYMYTNTLTFM